VSGVRVHDRAGDAEAVEGVVLVEGPDGVALTLTPRAASVMSRRLAASASRAAAQRRKTGPAEATSFGD
jgi:hypothetical protein